MPGAVSGMMGEFPRNRYSTSPVFPCRCAGSFQSLKPGTRRAPSSTRRRLSGWTAYRARSCGMKGVFFSVDARRLSSSASPEASFFPSSPEISKVRDMTACTTGADLIFPCTTRASLSRPRFMAEVAAFMVFPPCVFRVMWRHSLLSGSILACSTSDSVMMGVFFRNSRSRCIFPWRPRNSYV